MFTHKQWVRANLSSCWKVCERERLMLVVLLAGFCVAYIIQICTRAVRARGRPWTLSAHEDACSSALFGALQIASWIFSDYIFLSNWIWKRNFTFPTNPDAQNSIKKIISKISFQTFKFSLSWNFFKRQLSKIYFPLSSVKKIEEILAPR